MTPTQEPCPPITRAELEALFDDPSTQAKLRDKILEPGVEGLLVMQAGELYSGPGAGHHVALQYGPNNTFKAEDLVVGRLVNSPFGGSMTYVMRSRCPRSEYTLRWDSTNPPQSAMPKDVELKTVETGRASSKTPDMKPVDRDHAVATEHLTEMDFAPGVSTPTVLSDVETRREWPKLFKKTTGGKTQEWEVWVERTPDDHGRIHTKYGLQDGKKQEQTDVVEKGKNLGKRNATTAYQQACLEAEAEWKKQLERKGYGRDVEQSAATRAASPMLAHPLDKVKPADIDWGNAYAQPKFDGFRCLAEKKAGKVTLRSREGKPILTMPHVVEELERIMPDGLTIDGELYRHEPFDKTGVPAKPKTDDPDEFYASQESKTAQHFQDLASAIKKLGPLSPQVQYHVYDQLADDGFWDRFQVAKSFLAASGKVVQWVETIPVADLDQLREYQAKCIHAGFEGCMLRHGTKAYDAGKRSKHLLKVKEFKDEEFEVVEVREGRGTHKGMAIFLCKTAKGATFEVTAPGGHWEKKQYWLQRKKCVGKPLTVKFFEYTGGDSPVPRFPVALRFRDGAPFDMPPNPDAGLTHEEKAARG